jgi:hypothetical protein
MRDDQIKELRRIQEVSIDNAIAEFDEACGLSLQEQQERGDRRWLTQMASSSIKLSADIARILAQRVKPDTEEDEDVELKALIQSAQNRVVAFDRSKQS